MVYISKVYTRGGDRGQTSLADGARVDKDSARIAAYGDVDELNAWLGMLRVELARDGRRDCAYDFVTKLDEQLGRIQQELFNLGAELATPGADPNAGNLAIHARHIDALEQEIDAYNDALEPLRSFILPGGGPVGATTHVCRTVCRRAERKLVSLARAESIRDETVRYLNRLSDWLFVVGRAAAHAIGYDETLWDPSKV